MALKPQEQNDASMLLRAGYPKSLVRAMLGCDLRTLEKYMDTVGLTARPNGGPKGAVPATIRREAKEILRKNPEPLALIDAITDLEPEADALLLKAIADMLDGSGGTLQTDD